MIFLYKYKQLIYENHKNLLNKSKFSFQITNTSNLSHSKLHLLSLTTSPPLLKALLELAEEAGMHKYFLENFSNIRKL